MRKIIKFLVVIVVPCLFIMSMLFKPIAIHNYIHSNDDMDDDDTDNYENDENEEFDDFDDLV